MDPNACRDGKFEIWYVKFTDPESGIHVLYDLMHFRDGDLCRIAFEDGRGEGCVFTERYDSGTLVASDETFDVRLGENRLNQAGGTAQAGNDPGIVCDLSFVWGELGFDFNPRLMYRVPLADMMMVSPALDLKVSGTVKLGEREYTFDGAPGTQTHYWGRRLYPNWVYLSCNGSPENDFVFEVSAPRLPLLGLRGTAVVRHRGTVYGMNDLRAVLHDVRILADGRQGVWVVEAKSRKRRFVVTVIAAPGSMLVTHEKRKRKVLYTGCADCYVSIYRRGLLSWKKMEDFNSLGRCAAETRI